MEKLDNYFTPKKNVTYEIFRFRKAVQQSGETVDQFATRLRKLASTCEFTDLEEKKVEVHYYTELSIKTFEKSGNS